MNQIIDIAYENEELITRLAAITRAAFKETAPNWLTTDELATKQVLASASQNRLGRVSLSGGNPTGWIAVIQRRHVWEIHPIAVDPTMQANGTGRNLVEDIAQLARDKKISTLFAATSDETGTTNLYGENLYKDPSTAIKQLDSKGRSPYKFWESVGFTVVGILPDEEGPGKPGIHLARKP